MNGNVQNVGNLTCGSRALVWYVDAVIGAEDQLARSEAFRKSNGPTMTDKPEDRKKPGPREGCSCEVLRRAAVCRAQVRSRCIGEPPFRRLCTHLCTCGSVGESARRTARNAAGEAGRHACASRLFLAQAARGQKLLSHGASVG